MTSNPAPTADDLRREIAQIEAQDTARIDAGLSPRSTRRLFACIDQLYAMGERL